MAKLYTIWFKTEVEVKRTEGNIVRKTIQTYYDVTEAQMDTYWAKHPGLDMNTEPQTRALGKSPDISVVGEEPVRPKVDRVKWWDKDGSQTIKNAATVAARKEPRFHPSVVEAPPHIEQGFAGVVNKLLAEGAA